MKQTVILGNFIAYIGDAAGAKKLVDKNAQVLGLHLHKFLHQISQNHCDSQHVRSV